MDSDIKLANFLAYVFLFIIVFCTIGVGAYCYVSYKNNEANKPQTVECSPVDPVAQIIDGVNKLAEQQKGK